MRALPLLALLLIVAGPTTARAGCESLRSYDARLACFAEQRQDPSGCTSIKDNDQRELCRMRAGQRDLFGRRQDGTR
jgi:hypothetical protein